jgi:hypothetical protein
MIIVEASPIKAEATVLVVRMKNENLLVSVSLYLFFIVIGFSVDSNLSVMFAFRTLFKSLQNSIYPAIESLQNKHNCRNPWFSSPGRQGLGLDTAAH